MENLPPDHKWNSIYVTRPAEGQRCVSKIPEEAGWVSDCVFSEGYFTTVKEKENRVIITRWKHELWLSIEDFKMLRNPTLSEYKGWKPEVGEMFFSTVTINGGERIACGPYKLNQPEELEFYIREGGIFKSREAAEESISLDESESNLGPLSTSSALNALNYLADIAANERLNYLAKLEPKERPVQTVTPGGLYYVACVDKRARLMDASQEIAINLLIETGRVFPNTGAGEVAAKRRAQSGLLPPRNEAKFQSDLANLRAAVKEYNLPENPGFDAAELLAVVDAFLLEYETN